MWRALMMSVLISVIAGCAWVIVAYGTESIDELPENDDEVRERMELERQRRAGTR